MAEVVLLSRGSVLKVLRDMLSEVHEAAQSIRRQRRTSVTSRAAQLSLFRERATVLTHLIEYYSTEGPTKAVLVNEQYLEGGGR